VAGVHAISGGLGQDTFLVTSAGSAVKVDLGTGLVTGGYASGSTLLSVEAVSARNGNFTVELIGTAAAETFTGGRLDDILTGGGGNDRLIGGRGSDMLIGGAGNDSFVYVRGEIDGDIILDFQGAGVAGGDVLVLTDVLGATPANVAQQWARDRKAKIVAGVNLPMLLRSVCYRHEPLEGLLQRAMTGGALGVVEISPPV
jgi:Ca2+-binding RTX toxin-like protein